MHFEHGIYKYLGISWAYILYSKYYIVKGEVYIYINEVCSLLSSADTYAETLTQTKWQAKFFIIIIITFQLHIY